MHETWRLLKYPNEYEDVLLLKSIMDVRQNFEHNWARPNIGSVVT